MKVEQRAVLTVADRFPFVDRIVRPVLLSSLNSKSNEIVEIRWTFYVANVSLV